MLNFISDKKYFIENKDERCKKMNLKMRPVGSLLKELKEGYGELGAWGNPPQGEKEGLCVAVAFGDSAELLRGKVMELSKEMQEKEGWSTVSHKEVNGLTVETTVEDKSGLTIV